MLYDTESYHLMPTTVIYYLKIFFDDHGLSLKI